MYDLIYHSSQDHCNVPIKMLHSGTNLLSEDKRLTHSTKNN